MRRINLSLLVLLLSAACTGGGDPATGGTETGNTAAVSIRVVGYESGAAALTVGDIEITRAEIVLDRLRFRPFATCDDEDESDIRFDGPFIADLLNPAPLAGLEDISVPSGLYCRIELTFKKLEDDAGGGDLAGRSILIQGERSDGVPFEMTTEVDEEFELENETTGFEIAATDDLRIFFIAFDLGRWFDGVDLFAAEVTGSGPGAVILIDDGNNEPIQEQIEENLKHSADLFEDADDDEQLDPEEEDDSLASGSSVP
jgi:hypothetical protein